MEENYQCHICMEIAHKPVVTPCGHLFCWQCIYHWLRSNQEYLTCPICKSGLELSSLRPILLKNQPPEKSQLGVPPRPRPKARAIRQNLNPREIPRSILSMGMNVQRGVLLAGYGIFPSAYMCLFQNTVAPKPHENPFDEKDHQLNIYRKVRILSIFIMTIFLLIVLLV